MAYFEPEPYAMDWETHVPGDGPYKTCPECGNKKRTTRTGVMARHRMWTGVQMVVCPGVFKRPQK